ncbi:PhoH family protein [Garciella nitratireducens]|uniref:PhoH-like protein n=1 Tax=Garciella nitratireducens DSM 15102 TaxID=1121911 RepID=A0A1T4JRK3_9FIRM|nr:PhoH family protein [Garciella nitratireducens]SJZ32773.1 phosphate starvation-inducible protein PhoH [Garciella nitratireducens DSM 15102]
MQEDLIEEQIKIENLDYQIQLFGNFDENVKIIEKNFPVQIISRDDMLKIIGKEEDVNSVKNIIQQLLESIKNNNSITSQSVEYIVGLAKKGEENKFSTLSEVICYTAKGKVIRTKTLGQKKYVEAIKNNEVVFGIGPAGTGKTYLAMAMAVTALKNEEVNRIILTRPAVEAGESLGFLPGDLQEKVDPYLRPLYDALYDIMGSDTYLSYIEKGIIEVAPLAYMRGRTLDDSFIILDEAQNTTPEQMKMFLTRLGFGSKAIITGDVTQVDLPQGRESGLKVVTKILNEVSGIDFVYLTQSDVVRHPLVQRIIEAYDIYDKKE